MKNKKTNLIISAVLLVFAFTFLIGNNAFAGSPVPLRVCQSDSMKECNWFSGQCPQGWKNAESPLGVSSFPAAPSGNIQESFGCTSIGPFTSNEDFYLSGYEGSYYNPLKICQDSYPNANSVIYINGLEYPDSCFYPIGVTSNGVKCDKYREGDVGPTTIFQCLKSESVVPYLFCCPPPSCEISASSTSINSGDSVILIWSSKNANSVVSSNNLNSTQEVSGNITKKPTGATTYQLRVASSSGETATCQTTVIVKEPPKPLPTISGPCQNLVPCKDDCKLSDIFVMIQNIVNCLVAISTIICLLFLVIGGLLYIFSLGNQENLTKAKNTILWALGGLALVFLAWLIVNTIMLFMGVGGGFLMWSSVG